LSARAFQGHFTLTHCGGLVMSRSWGLPRRAPIRQKRRPRASESIALIRAGKSWSRTRTWKPSISVRRITCTTPWRWPRELLSEERGPCDTLESLVESVYSFIAAGGDPVEDHKFIGFPTFDDGYRASCVVDAAIRSNVGRNRWIKVEY
jgi:hypothetical protein